MAKRWMVAMAVTVAMGGSLTLGAVTLGAGRTLWSRLGGPQLLVADTLERRSAETKTLSQDDGTATAEVGIVIVHIAPDSPALAAGLQRGDILIAVNDAAVNTMAELRMVLASFTAEDEVTLRITRGGEAHTLTATLVEREGRAFLGIVGGDCGVGGGSLIIETGAHLVAIAENSPAAEAGLQVGDTITALDGEAIMQGTQLADAIAAHKPGDSVTLTVKSVDSTERDIAVPLATHPADDTRAYLGVEYGSGIGGGRGHGMLPFPSLTEGITSTVVLVVGAVEADSAADTAGLQEGDHITEIDGKSVSDLVESGDDVSTIFAAYQPGDAVVLTVVRRNEAVPFTVTATLEAGEAGNAKLGIQAGIIFRVDSTNGNIPDRFIPRPDSVPAPQTIPAPAVPEISA